MKKIKSIHFAFILFLVFISRLYSQEIVEASRTGDLAKVKEIIKSDPLQVNVKDANGRTPLHWAARGVHFELLLYLVEKGAEVNAKDVNGVAPLHSLTSRAHLDGTAFLLKREADINIRTNNGDTPLFYGILSGNMDIIRLLLENGADCDVQNSTGDMPLNLAVMNRKKEAVDLLLDRNAGYDGSGIKSLNLLQISLRNGLDRMSRILIEKGGDILFADKEKNKWTMLDAVSGGSIELVDLLIAKKVFLTKKGDLYGWTPIHYAANNGKTTMIEYLVKHGVDIHARTKGGETAYNLAEQKGNREVKDLIVRLGGKTDPVSFPVLRGKYLGQKPPGTKPVVFAPGIISRPDLRELTITFSPDDQELFFYRLLEDNFARIYNCKVENGAWSSPKEFGVTSAYSAMLPFIPLDNRRLFFSWNNPEHPFGVYVSERTAGSWSAPNYAGPGLCLTQTRDGQFYITEIPGDNLNPTTYLSKVTIENNRFTNFERLVFTDESRGRGHPCIAPDGSFIIFDHGGGDHIQISFRKKDGTWGNALDMTKLGFEPLMGIPSISKDGKYLFFKLGCRGQLDVGHGDTNRDIWWVDIRVIEMLRPQE